MPVSPCPRKNQTKRTMTINKKMNTRRKTPSRVGSPLQRILLPVLLTSLAVFRFYFDPHLNPYLRGQDDNIVRNDRLCYSNPYLPALFNASDALHTMDYYAWLWNRDFDLINQQLQEQSRGSYSHKRFDAFPVLEHCRNITCVGGDCKAEPTKVVCGMELLEKAESCVVYSIGGDNQWQFEEAIEYYTKCEVHTFDCTGRKERFTPPEGVDFHHICLGEKDQPAKPLLDPRPHDIVGPVYTLATIQERLQHKQIDLLKIDVEGFEWPVFENWYNAYKKDPSSVVLPMQIVMEVHYRSSMAELSSSEMQDFKSENDLMHLSRMMMEMGYATVIRNDDVDCLHCTELTLMRYRC